MTDWGIQGALAMFGVALVGWNLALGARVTALPTAGRAFRVLSGLCAFLLIPALVIGLLAPTAPGMRILGPLAWLWPVVVVAVAAQALWVLGGGRTSAAVAFPIALYDLVVAWVAVTRWIEGQGALLPAWSLAPGMAVSTIGATVLGDGAFLWSAAVLVPLVVVMVWMGVYPKPFLERMEVTVTGLLQTVEQKRTPPPMFGLAPMPDAGRASGR